MATPLTDPDPVKTLVFILKNTNCCVSSSSSSSNECGPCYNAENLKIVPWRFDLPDCAIFDVAAGPKSECEMCPTWGVVIFGQVGDDPEAPTTFPVPPYPDLYSYSLDGHLVFDVYGLAGDGTWDHLFHSVDEGTIPGSIRYEPFTKYTRVRLDVHDGLGNFIESCCVSPPFAYCGSSSSESQSTGSHGSAGSTSSAGSHPSGSTSGSGGGGGGNSSSSSGSFSSGSSSSGSSGSGSHSGSGSSGSNSSNSGSGPCTPFDVGTFLLDGGTTYTFFVGTQYSGRPWTAAPSFDAGTVDGAGNIVYTPVIGGLETITVQCP